MEYLNAIVCPVCGDTLRRVGGSLICGAGHTYDVAKAGYVNLLPPGKEKNARTGDEKIMVRARVDFLARGYYEAISATLGTLLGETLPQGDAPLVVCDMGCGEGWHTCRIAEQLHSDTGREVLAFGCDASKYAAECGCKLARSRGYQPREGIGAAWDAPVQAYFLSANLFHMPLRNASADAAVSMFAPIAGEEARRILKPGGILAVVSSGKNHLLEMRERIYTDVRLSQSLPAVPDGFIERFRRSLTYPVTLESREAIESLFVMTPFYYKTTEEGRTRLLEKEQLTVTVDVNYTLFEAV